MRCEVCVASPLILHMRTHAAEVQGLKDKIKELQAEVVFSRLHFGCNPR